MVTELQTLQWSDILPPEIGGQWAELRKMLEAGAGVDAALFTGGRALQYESLEGVLHKVVLTEEDAMFFKLCPKQKIFATVDQYDRLTDTGPEWGLAVTETGLPGESDATIQRAFTPVKYYSTLRRVSHVAQLTRMVEDPVAVQIWAGTQQLIKRIDHDMFWGDTDVFPERIGGMIPLLSQPAYAATNYNANGNTLQRMGRTPINYVSGLIRQRAGRPTHLFYPPMLAEDMSLVYATAERVVVMPNGPAERVITTGGLVSGVQTAHGSIQFVSEVFARPPMLPTSAVGPNPPAAPDALTLAEAGAEEPTGSLPAGDYYYLVTAVNENGESAPTAASGAVSVTTTGCVKVTITPADTSATGFRIYRSALGAEDDSDCRFLAQIPAAPNEAGATVWYDTGYWVPGTYHIIIGDLRPEARSVQLSQLFPLTKVDLARVGRFEQFLINYYAAFRKAKPEWWGMIRNVLAQYDYDMGWRPLGQLPSS